MHLPLTGCNHTMTGFRISVTNKTTCAFHHCEHPAAPHKRTNVHAHVRHRLKAQLHRQAIQSLKGRGNNKSADGITCPAEPLSLRFQVRLHVGAAPAGAAAVAAVAVAMSVAWAAVHAAALAAAAVLAARQVLQQRRALVLQKGRSGPVSRSRSTHMMGSQTPPTVTATTMKC